MVDVDIRWPGPDYPLGCEMEKGIHIFVMRRTHGTLSLVIRALNTFGEEIVRFLVLDHVMSAWARIQAHSSTWKS